MTDNWTTTKRARRKPNKVKWACPRCGIDDKAEHTQKVRDVVECQSNACSGFICECDGETPKGHGDTPATACPNAVCYHCRWSGVWPPRPKNLTEWEEKALAAGWTPPPEWDGQNINWKDLYARKKAEALDMREHLTFILRFFRAAWDEDEEFFEGAYALEDMGRSIPGHWCPAMIEELKELLDDDIEWNPADVSRDG